MPTGHRDGPLTVLVYQDGQAADHARLIRAPRGRVRVLTATTLAEAARWIETADILYTWKLPPELLVRAPRLQWIQLTGAGVDHVLAAPPPPGVAVTRVTGVFGPWMAEYVVGWLLWVTQRMEAFRLAQRRHRWAPADPTLLRGQTLGILGLGSIGRVVARTARGLGLRVIGLTRSGRPVPGAARVYPVRRLRSFLAAADHVALCAPLTPATRGLLGTAELRAMRPTAWLINVGRGAVVDEAALERALRARWIAGAILDVFAVEPLPRRHRLWELPNVVVTPHISGPSLPRDIVPLFNANLARFLAGRRLRGLVDLRRGY